MEARVQGGTRPAQCARPSAARQAPASHAARTVHAHAYRTDRPAGLKAMIVRAEPSRAAVGRCLMQQQAVGRRAVQAASRRPDARCSAQAGQGQGQGQAKGQGPTGLNVDGARPTSPRGWALMIEALKEAKVRLVSAQELIFSQDKGAVVIDIRPESDYDKGHIPGAVNVPFYQPIDGWSGWQVVRKVAFAAFGILNGTEVNPNFVEEVAEAVEGGKPLILYCSMGGHLDPVSTGAAAIPQESEMSGQEGAGAADNKRKVQTRSMIAAYQLLRQGHSDISILKGGFSDWRASGRDYAVMEEVKQ